MKTVYPWAAHFWLKKLRVSLSMDGFLQGLYTNIILCSKYMDTKSVQKDFLSVTNTNL